MLGNNGKSAENIGKNPQKILRNPRKMSENPRKMSEKILWLLKILRGPLLRLRLITAAHFEICMARQNYAGARSTLLPIGPGTPPITRAGSFLGPRPWRESALSSWCKIIRTLKVRWFLPPYVKPRVAFHNYSFVGQWQSHVKLGFTLEFTGIFLLNK